MSNSLIGSGANQVPTNGLLGTMAFEDNRNYKKIQIDGVEIGVQKVPSSKSGAVTLTIDELRNGIVEYTGSVNNLQLPTATNTLASIGVKLDSSFDFSVINTGSGAATLTTNVGATLVGSMLVTNGTSGRFRIRVTSDSTYTIYRLC